MGTLVPHFEQSPQPGRTNYYKRLLHNIFGTVNSSNGQRYVSIVDKTGAGEKDSDHVISNLKHYVHNSINILAKYLKNYLDSAPYFKFKCIIWWVAEKVETVRFMRVILSYMVPGHTKFDPYTPFSATANTSHNMDVFSTSELLDLVKECTTCHAMAEVVIGGGSLYSAGSIQTPKASRNLSFSILNRALKGSWGTVSLSTEQLK